MIVHCPDCGQELTDSTPDCPRCGCHALAKRLEIECSSKTFIQKIYEWLNKNVKARYSPFYFWFFFCGNLDRTQFLLSRIYSCTIFFAVFHAVKKHLLPETLAMNFSFCGIVFYTLLALDIPVVWKRACTLGWPKIPTVLVLTLSGALFFTNILAINVFARYIWFLLNAAMFAFSSFEETKRP